MKYFISFFLFFSLSLPICGHCAWVVYDESIRDGGNGVAYDNPVPDFYLLRAGSYYFISYSAKETGNLTLPSTWYVDDYFPAGGGAIWWNRKCCGNGKSRYNVGLINASAVPGYDPTETGGGLDVDNDGTPDWMDSAPNDPTIPFVDPYGDDDGDGVPNIDDPAPYDINIPPDSVMIDDGQDLDGDGLNNYWDDDVDGDGILNASDCDDDNDGILDWVDFAPYSPDNPEWRELSYVKDIDGYKVGGTYEVKGFGVTQWGESTSAQDYVYINPSWQPATSFESSDIPAASGASGGGGSGSGTPPPYPDPTPRPPEGVPDRPSGDPDIIGEGEGNEGNVTDLDYLASLVANTQQEIVAATESAKILQGIESAQKSFGLANQRGLEQIFDALDGAPGGGATAVDIGAAVESAQSESVNNDIADYPGSHPGEQAGSFTNYQESDIPDVDAKQTEYAAAISDVITDSAVSTLGDSVGVATSASNAVISFTAFGATIDCDFSKYTDIYNIIGTAFVSLCYLFGFFAIMKS